VIFGDLLKFLALAEPHPACCAGLELSCNKRLRRDRTSPCFNSSRPQVAADTYFDRRACACTHGEVVTAVSPLYPNPWRKKCWGPFTLFRSSIRSTHGLGLFRESPRWRDVAATHEYTHFDEWWGPFTQRGCDTSAACHHRAARHTWPARATTVLHATRGQLETSSSPPSHHQPHTPALLALPCMAGTRRWAT
jgi:hypothetical protein